ncbi:MAG TPA: regulatory protein RecX [Chloroflexota bacterium]
MRQRLRRAGAEAVVIESVLSQLRRHSLVDDQAFAEYWVEQRQTFRPRGARLVRAELAQRGIARAGAEAATAPLEGTASEDAYRAAGKRAGQLRTCDEPEFTRRLGQWLARRGFDWDTITPVVARLWAERVEQPLCKKLGR